MVDGQQSEDKQHEHVQKAAEKPVLIGLWKFSLNSGVNLQDLDGKLEILMI